MQQYFDAQMRLLNIAGKQFAEHYPEHAGFLNIDSLKDRDPHIERLLEGVAYLSAYTQKRLDETLPEVSEHVLRQLCPLLVGDYPSTTVLQFQPLSMMQSSLAIKRGTTVKNGSPNRENLTCYFSTVTDTTLVPLTIEAVDYNENHRGGELSITLQWCCRGEKENYDLRSLRFYLHGDTPLSSSLSQFLTTAVRPVTVDFGAEHREFDCQLRDSQCRHSFAEIDGAVLPTAAQSHPGYSLLLDYFNAKDRHYFVELSGLDEVVFPKNNHRFTLKFESAVKLPPGHQLGTDNIRLNCVQAVNLYEQDGEPIHIEHNNNEYMVVADKDNTQYVHTFSVDKIVGRNAHTGQEFDYLSRYKSVFQDETRLYSLVQRQVSGPIATYYVQVPLVKQSNQETLSLSLTAFNGGWPRQLLQEGDLNKGQNDMPHVVKVGNITRPSQYTPRPQQCQHWQLISILNLKFSQFTSALELQKLLAVFDWSKRNENRNRIESIKSVTTAPVSLVKRGVFIKGIDIKLELDEAKFVCLADIHHFCTVLHQFFILYAPLNECVQTTAVCLPSYTQWQWDIASGKSRQI